MSLIQQLYQLRALLLSFKVLESMYILIFRSLNEMSKSCSPR